MKKVYRIKIITYKDGTVKYIAQRRTFIFTWIGILYGGGENPLTFEFRSRKDALAAIDSNFTQSYKDKNTVVSINFEYITKQTNKK